jgi:hypothetical protein
MAFTLYHVYHTPKVIVDTILTKKLPGGLTEVTATIKNVRVIPTHTAHDIQNKITRPDWVTIKGGKILTGAIAEDRFTDRIMEQKRNPERMEISNIPGMGAVYVRWIIDGNGPFEVSVDAAKGGKHSKRSK